MRLISVTMLQVRVNTVATQSQHRKTLTLHQVHLELFFVYQIAEQCIQYRQVSQLPGISPGCSSIYEFQVATESR